MSDSGGSASERPPRVMVVEPDSEECRNLVRILEGAGAEVLSAARGLQALELFMRERFDLVLSAMEVPELSGAELLKRVTERSCSARVALMATWRSRSQFEEMTQFGVFAFLRKPVREHEVLRMLSQLKTEVDFLE